MDLSQIQGPDTQASVTHAESARRNIYDADSFIAKQNFFQASG
ncbi:hypothetical protein PROVALCAL_01408 [Providencia alcalifaciens DSM 30120]|uniref:Uncharacterized protein n=1 Tax=Providencia alcalifaciens DSM 30120 TaxID=520999 RepID=B6XDI6_9GAMM|nr:hypothetical protein PROVALCAL_01408 [Providencia alcalifaciens DSM 30120]